MRRRDRNAGVIATMLVTLGLLTVGPGTAQAAADTTGPTFTMQFSAHFVYPSDVIGVQGVPGEEWSLHVRAVQKWSASDPSGICKYELYSYDAREAPGLVYSGLNTSYSFVMGDVNEDNGGYFWFHWILRVQDCAGNWSNNDDWGGLDPNNDRYINQPGARNSTVTYDDPTVTYTGTWATAKCKCFVGGTNRNATKAGASATFTYTGAVAAWVSETGPGRGKAKVYQDGVLKATVNLYAATNGPARVMWANWFPTVGKHTIKIVVVGTAGHPRVDIDGFLVGPNPNAT